MSLIKLMAKRPKSMRMVELSSKFRSRTSNRRLSQQRSKGKPRNTKERISRRRFKNFKMSMAQRLFSVDRAAVSVTPKITRRAR